MYSFYKVKSRKNQQEFRHPFFRKEHPDDLKYIKRKNVNKKFKHIVETPVKEEPFSVSHSKVKEQIEKLQNVLDFIAEQNKTLAQTNRTIVGQLYGSKSYCEAQIRDFISMMFVCMNVPNSKLSGEFKNYLDSLELDANSLPMPSLLDRNIGSTDMLFNNQSKNFNIQEAMDGILTIFRSHIPEETVNKSTVSVTEQSSSVEEPAFAVLPTLNDARATFIPRDEPISLPKAAWLQEPTTPLANVNLNLDDKFGLTVSPVKQKSIIDDLNHADLIFNSFYREREDLMSLSEFVYTPVTPLFQEDF